MTGVQTCALPICSVGVFESFRCGVWRKSLKLHRHDWGASHHTMLIQLTYDCCLSDVAWWLLIVCFSMFVPFMCVIRRKSRWGWVRGGVGWSRPGTRALCWRQAIHPCIPILPMFYYLHCFTKFYYYVSYILVASFGLDGNPTTIPKPYKSPNTSYVST